MSVAADPKPVRRIVDGHAYRRFHETMPRCLFCAERFGHAHHVLPKARGGDDLLQNFVSLCSRCHGAVHGNPFTFRPFGSDSIRVSGQMVRRRIGAWLSSEDGRQARAYLSEKLGPAPAARFAQKEYGVRSFDSGYRLPS